jgi:ubiquitin-conjugating enzyme E2 D/E
MLKRLKLELKKIKKDPPSNCSAGLVNGDLCHWEAVIFGLIDTLYSGGIFKLDIKFTQDYPFTAPKVKFLTRVYHPNVSEHHGDICLDILKNNWSPALSVKNLLLSICSLLSDPNVDDPLNSSAARLYKRNKLEYDIKVRNYVQKYATLGNNNVENSENENEDGNEEV